MNYVIIDGNNHACIAAARAMKAVQTNPSTDMSDMLYYTLSSMIKVLKRQFPGQKYYVCWDTKGGTQHRKEIDASYKATRDNSMFDFKAIEANKFLYQEYGIESVSVPECEGDDAIWSLARLIHDSQLESHVTIVSRDHDLIQVVQAGYADNVYDPVKKQNMEIPFYPITEFKALVGDASDNISGIRGIGPKTALKILTGKQLLTESQKAEFEHYLLLVDASKNPREQINYDFLKGQIKFD